MSKYIIIHGQLRQISDDELMHFKYIKREKKNGKWVYYYDESALENTGIAELRKDSARQLKESQARYQTAVDNRNELGKLGTVNDKDRKSAELDVKLASSHLENKMFHAKYWEKRYKTLKVKTFAARTISKGVVKIANLLSGGKKKKKK